MEVLFPGDGAAHPVDALPVLNWLASLAQRRQHENCDDLPGPTPRYGGTARSRPRIDEPIFGNTSLWAAQDLRIENVPV